MFRQPLLLMLATIVQHLLLCLVLLNELGALCPDTSKNSQLHIVTNLRWNFECAVLNAYCIEHTLPHARTGCAELLRRHAAVGGVSATSTCTCSGRYRPLRTCNRSLAMRPQSFQSTLLT